jgi:hypothetical protein
MIDLESQSQVMRPKKFCELAIARVVGDSVLYHSLSGLVSGHSGRLAQTATIRPLGCSRKMRPLAFLDPSAFIITYSPLRPFHSARVQFPLRHLRPQ